MKTMNLLTIAFILSLSPIVSAQITPVIEHNDIPTIEPLRLSGPRVGVTYINQPTKVQVDGFGLDSGMTVNPLVSQFGWQFEWKYFETANGSAGLFEFIPLIGGLDQGMFIPSANMLVGYRTPEGWEIGFGPNLSLVGTGFIIAGGYTFKSGYMNFPVNVGIIPGKENTRISILIGWNKRS